MISGKPLLSATLHSHQIKAPKGASVTLGLTTTYNTEYGPIHTSKPTGSQNVAVSAYSKCAHFDFTQVPLRNFTKYSGCTRYKIEFAKDQFKSSNNCFVSPQKPSLIPYLVYLPDSKLDSDTSSKRTQYCFIQILAQSVSIFL